MLTQAVVFLLDAIGGLLTLVLLARFLMQAFRVPFANPLGAFVVQASNWLVLPLRRIIPGVLGYDFASLLAAWLVQFAVLVVALALRNGFALPAVELWIGVPAWHALLAVVRNGLYLLIGALILQAVLSWVNPYAPLARPLNQFTRPLLDPIRRVVPPLASVDLSPLVAILLLQVLLIFL